MLVMKCTHCEHDMLCNTHSCWPGDSVTLNSQACALLKQRLVNELIFVSDGAKREFVDKPAVPRVHRSTSLQKIYLSLLLFGQLLLQLLQLLSGALAQLAVGGRQLVQLSLDIGALLWGQPGHGWVTI